MSLHLWLGQPAPPEKRLKRCRLARVAKRAPMRPRSNDGSSTAQGLTQSTLLLLYELVRRVEVVVAGVLGL